MRWYCFSMAYLLRIIPLIWKEGYEMRTPGFTSEAVLPSTVGRYQNTFSHALARDYVVPALPAAATCDYACDMCYDCIENGGTQSTCRGCNVCRYCAQTGDGRQSGIDTRPSRFEFNYCTWTCRPQQHCWQESRGGPYICSSYTSCGWECN